MLLILFQLSSHLIAEKAFPLDYEYVIPPAQKDDQVKMLSHGEQRY